MFVKNLKEAGVLGFNEVITEFFGNSGKECNETYLKAIVPTISPHREIKSSKEIMNKLKDITTLHIHFKEIPACDLYNPSYYSYLILDLEMDALKESLLQVLNNPKNYFQPVKEAILKTLLSMGIARGSIDDILEVVHFLDNTEEQYNLVCIQKLRLFILF